MSKSILVTEKGKCFLCRRYGQTEKHHIFEGSGRRRLSEKYGLWVDLCHRCHNEPPCGVHFNKRRDLVLKASAQIRAMSYYGWSEDDFRKHFRKSYIKENDYAE